MLSSGFKDLIKMDSINDFLTVCGNHKALILSINRFNVLFDLPAGVAGGYAAGKYSYPKPSAFSSVFKKKPKSFARNQIQHAETFVWN